MNILRKKLSIRKQITQAVLNRPLSPRVVTCLLISMIYLAGFTLNAQVCGFVSGQGCPGTDYSNYGINSTIAATLEYDNFVSGFHQTVVRESNGDFRVWGESTKNNGTAHLLSPTVINSINFPGLTGKPLKATIGSASNGQSQVILLTTDGLWAWGLAGTVLSNSPLVKSTTAFGKVTLGLPAGVTPTDVKMLFATRQSLAITTCSGDVWVLTNHGTGAMRGDGTTGQAGWNTTWARVQKTDGTPLTNVVATRGSTDNLIALTASGELYTWGDKTRLGTGATGDVSAVTRSRATLMQAPSTTDGPIKMIGSTCNSFNMAYYVLYGNGKLFALGDNASRLIGDFTTTNRNQWARPLYPNTSDASLPGLPMDDILWISPNEHDPTNPFINVISADNNRLFSWGYEDGTAFGRTGGNGPKNPGEAPSIAGGNVQTVESGGHTTMIVKKCESHYGYVGHQINGSIGDGVLTNSFFSNYTFSTSPLAVCGAPTGTPAIRIVNAPSVNDNGEFCLGTSVLLEGTPAGGTFAITAGAGIASLAANTLNFTGSGTVTVSYNAPVADCPAGVVTKNFFVVNCAPTVTVSGTVWNDDNGNAVQDGGESGIANNMWANLVGPDGNVIASVKVNADGTYSFLISQTLLTTSGNYLVTLTNNPKNQGEPLASADTPTGGFGYTGTNQGGVANPGNRTGTTSVGNLSTAAANSTIPNVNFGISNNPATLPVNFGLITGKILNGQLIVKWNTLSETNNDHFEIEVSADGKTFVKAGTVQSQAQNGNSTESLAYEYTTDASNSALAIGIGIFVLGAAGLGWMRRHKLAFGAMILAGSLVFASGCKRADGGLTGEGKIFVRIAQVDKDGNKTYSKVITAVKE
ncbi:SdrD B-like domain-containing protein [Niabella sp. 22666]|uniref:SdrD B-like domain-containing protein n=1 Tax=Niabella sp. 22666 TaxID=3453954 RepID=UPI003F8336FD